MQPPNCPSTSATASVFDAVSRLQRSRHSSIDGAVPGTSRLAMCLHPASPLPVPDDTAKIARRAFPRGNLLLSLRDKLGPVFDDSRFAHLFPAKGNAVQTRR